MRPGYVARNARDLIKNPRIENNVNLLSTTTVANKAILNIITGKATRKNNSKERYELFQKNYREP